MDGLQTPYCFASRLGAPVEKFETVDALAKRISADRDSDGLVLTDGMFTDSEEAPKGRRVVVVRQLAGDAPGPLIGYAMLVSRPGLGSFGERQTLSEAIRRADPALVRVHETSAPAFVRQHTERLSA